MADEPSSQTRAPVGGSTFEYEFETRERRVFDVTPYLPRGGFTRLRDRSIIISARVVAQGQIAKNLLTTTSSVI